MPLTEQWTFSAAQLKPFLVPEGARMIARPFQASQTILKGQPVGLVTTAVSAVQTITTTGVPTGGTFRLGHMGFTTAAIAHNAAHGVVATALAALPSIGAGNITSAGGPLPTGVTITFAGALAGQPVAPITVVENLLTGGTSPTPVVTQTTIGARAGGCRAWSGALAPLAPTRAVSVVAGGTVFGDGTATVAYAVTKAFFNESGTGLPCPAQQALIAAGNRTISVASFTGVAPEIQGARYYVNGSLAATTMNVAGTIAATTLTAWADPNLPQPDTNGCFNARDGSHNLLGFAACDIATDAEGRITLGRVAAAGMEHGQELLEGPVWVEGYFRVGDLTGITAANGPQLSRFARFVVGDWSTPDSIVYLR